MSLVLSRWLLLICGGLICMAALEGALPSGMHGDDLRDCHLLVGRRGSACFAGGLFPSFGSCRRSVAHLTVLHVRGCTGCLLLHGLPHDLSGSWL
jgi:hypothetical protein